MKKFAVTFLGVMICSVMSVCAEPSNYVQIGCPLNQPCAKQQPCEPPCAVEDECTMKEKFWTKRAALYKQLCLTEAQCQQAKCIDEKFFTDFYPLKKCYKEEKCKLYQMECSNACSSDIRCQKKKVRALKKQIKEMKKNHKDNFKCILNDCQKKQFRKIKDKKCKEVKVECPCK